MGFRSRILHCSDNLVLVSEPEIPMTAGTMSRGVVLKHQNFVSWCRNQCKWSAIYTVWLCTYILKTHIFVQMYVYTHFWINFEFSSNYSLSIFIFIFYTPWYRLYAGEMITRTSQSGQSLGDLPFFSSGWKTSIKIHQLRWTEYQQKGSKLWFPWLSTFQPFPTLGGNSGLDPGIYIYIYI